MIVTINYCDKNYLPDFKIMDYITYISINSLQASCACFGSTSGFF